MNRSFMIALLFLNMALGMTAQAAQSARVQKNDAKVYESSNLKSPVIETLSLDTVLMVSNEPTHGFYKARLPNESIGWISENDILTSIGSVKSDEFLNKIEKQTREKKFKSDSRIIIGAGTQSLTNGGFPTEIPMIATSGMGAMFELQYQIKNRFYWGLRIDYLSNTDSQDLSSTVTQTSTFHTMPLMLGVMFNPILNPSFRWSVGAYAGMSLLTALEVTQSTSTTSTSINYASNDLCEYINTQMSLAISDTVSILGEVGLRYHSASYPASATSTFGAPAFNANFGGMLIRLGLEFRP